MDENCLFGGSLVQHPGKVEEWRSVILCFCSNRLGVEELFKVRSPITDQSSNLHVGQFDAVRASPNGQRVQTNSQIPRSGLGSHEGIFVHGASPGTGIRGLWYSDEHQMFAGRLLVARLLGLDEHSGNFSKVLGSSLGRFWVLYESRREQCVDRNSLGSSAENEKGSYLAWTMRPQAAKMKSRRPMRQSGAVASRVQIFRDVIVQREQTDQLT